MRCRGIHYYEGGKISVLLTPEDTKLRGTHTLNRDALENYLTFPATKSLHLYCIDNENFEEVISLIRFVKSLYIVDIFCYYSSELIGERIMQLCPLVNNTIKIGV